MEPKFRGWVGVVFNRLGAPFATTMQRVSDLFPDPQQPNAMRSEHFRKVVSVYGNYDMIVVVESQNAQTGLLDLHRAVNTIIGTAQSGILYTRTYVAAETWSVGPTRYDGRQIPIGICTSAGRQEETRDALVKTKMFDIVDIVLGDFDILALFKQSNVIPRDILKMLRAAPNITRTTTFIPGELFDE